MADVTVYSDSYAPSRWRGQRWWRSTLFAQQTVWMAGFMARSAHPRHKMHRLWVDRSACPCFIDLTPHKFTTSAFLVLHLTGERFSGGMRSDRGREMEVKWKGRGRVRRRRWNEKESGWKEMRKPRRRRNKGRPWEKGIREGKEVRWKVKEEEGQSCFLWEDTALGQVREDWYLWVCRRP